MKLRYLLTIFVLSLAFVSFYNLESKSHFNNFSSGSRLPMGSYEETCYDCNVKDNVLSCRCKTRAGNLQRTSIYLPPCEINLISNQDGQLKCGY